MAFGHGGARRGSGRKPKSAEERRLSGDAGHRGRVLTHPSAPSASTPPADVVDPAALLTAIDEADAPNDLTVEERAVWLELAALALRRGKTLEAAQEYPFRLLCRNVALERRYAGSVVDAGGANHRGMIATIDRQLLRLGLIEFGLKAAPAKPAAPVDPLKEKYFGGRRNGA